MAALSFSLKEAVWFKKGQEVADLLSIELNPQIGIEEREEYVQVKGVLELFGEYNKKESEETFSLRDFSQATTVKEVIEREDGVHEFTHYFPVDITIPKKRVREIDDIYILVDSFDYEFPESNALNIVADLSITGLYEDGQRDEEEFFEDVEGVGDVEEQEEEEVVESEDPQGKEEGGAPNSYYQSMINNVFQEFSFEARKAPVEEEVEEQEEEQFQEEYEGEVAEEQELQNQSDLEGAEQEEVHLQGEREVEEPEQFEVHHQQEVEEPELTNQRESEEQEVFEQQDQENLEEQDEIVFPARQEIKLHFQNEPKQQEQESHPQFEFLMRQVKEVQEVEAAEVFVEEVEEEVKAEAVVPRSENELYLTKLFGNKEENFKKVRMYIVQSGDSLESIAEKYDLQVQQITKRNQLDEFYVTEGQILYLPVKKSK